MEQLQFCTQHKASRWRETYYLGTVIKETTERLLWKSVLHNPNKNLGQACGSMEVVLKANLLPLLQREPTPHHKGSPRED